MKKLLLVTSLLHVTAICLCAPSSKGTHNSSTTYDQRQVGKYNIHLNIKDVAIIALSSEDIVDHIGDSDSYDDAYYDYEDSEYTVNPITADLIGKPTTSKPSSSNQTVFPSIAGLNLSSISTSTGTASSTANIPSHQTVFPSISGLNLSSISTSTETAAASTANIPDTHIVIHEKPSAVASETNDKFMESSSVGYQPDQIPVQVIVEPILKPKIRPSAAPSMKRKIPNKKVKNDDGEIKPRRRRGEMIERMRLRRAQNRLSRNNGCENGQVSDGQNGCRVRRSGMGGLLGMLAKFLPQEDSE